jgi:twitching motility protein PilT
MAMELNLLLKKMVQCGASDLHVRSDGPAYLRINGNINMLGSSVMPSQEVETLVFSSMSQRVRNIFNERFEADFSVDGGELGRFRFNVFRQRGKVCFSVRHIPSRIPTFEELRLPADPLKKLTATERGLVLVTGITGSGKSSTLAAMIEHINQTMEGHIITIEDPVEFVYKDKKSIISQREVGSDTPSFLEALRAAMRQDPDVIMVGEMRDLETTRAAITAAETGHLVFGTVHTINAVQTISRVVDLFPPHQQTQVRMQLSDTLKGVISQRLLPCIKGSRIPAVEVLVVTAHVKKMIEENNLVGIAQAIQKGAFYGMQSFNQSLVKLHREGLVKLEDIVATATNPDDVLLAVRGIEQDIEGKK